MDGGEAGIKMKAILITLLTIFLLANISYFGFLYLAHNGSRFFLQIDSCLDNGGVWDYESSLCRKN